MPQIADELSIKKRRPLCGGFWLGGRGLFFHLMRFYTHRAARSERAGEAVFHQSSAFLHISSFKHTHTMCLYGIRACSFGHGISSRKISHLFLWNSYEVFETFVFAYKNKSYVVQIISSSYALNPLGITINVMSSMRSTRKTNAAHQWILRDNCQLCQKKEDKFFSLKEFWQHCS